MSAVASPWGARASDWAQVMEGWNGWGVPVYRHVLSLLPPLGEGSTVLDVGCGAGRFCRMAADRGATVSGIDSTEQFIEIARERVLDGDFRLGSMEELPWPDDSFDVATGFNSFFLADDMVAALREARRVAKPRGRVATTTFGRPARCDSTTVFRAIASLTEPEGSDGAEGPEPAQEDREEQRRLERVAAEAGLEVEEAGYLAFDERYENVETAARGMLAAPPFRRAAAVVGEDRVEAATIEALARFETPDGRCVLHEEACFLTARA